MKNYKLIGLFIGSMAGIFFLVNWTGSETSVSGNHKQTVNFDGILSTHHGKEYPVDNISIEGKTKEIPTYDTPASKENPALYQPQLNPETKRMEVNLDVNPATDFVKAQMDLAEISEIQVLNPDVTWVYQKEKKGRKVEFIEVTFITRSNTKSSNLVERNKYVNCDGIDPAGPQEKKVPLPAIKRLVIKGFKYRENFVNSSGDQTARQSQPVRNGAKPNGANSPARVVKPIQSNKDGV